MSRISRLREVEREYALLNTPFMKYTAFISYNSADDRWAKWLQIAVVRLYPLAYGFIFYPNKVL